jgi:hypothetical protein
MPVIIPYDPDFDSASPARPGFKGLNKRLLFYVGLALGVGLVSLISLVLLVL